MNATTFRKIDKSILDLLHSVVGDAGIITDANDKAPYLNDERGYYSGSTPMIVRPASTAEVSKIISICNESQTPVVPQGGNTGLCGGATPYEHGGEILLSLTRMNRIREIDTLNYAITVESGVILADVQTAAENAGRYFPLSLGGEGTARIGGNLSTNAGGTGVLRYGPARDLCLGLEAVLPDGRVWNGMTGLRKDNTGYDLKHLFIGAEGTLGIITAACLKLFPKPADIQTAFVAVESEHAAVELLARARQITDDRVVTFEYMPRDAIGFALKHIDGTRDPMSTAYLHYVLIELAAGEAAAVDLRNMLEEVLGDGMVDGLVLNAVFAESGQQASDFWKIRETIPEAQKYEGASSKHDISVPVSRVADFLVDAIADVKKLIPGVRPCAFGHVGDGNIHFNLSRPVDMSDDEFWLLEPELHKMVYDRTVAMGGSISAEHGIGRLRRDELKAYKSPVEMDVMRSIKETLDPNGIMNPGKVL
ncbi:MAG: putative FAD-linked oxidoreductase [Alphaproteobacteria bacterium MarineAlpha11_Bin1]|nr:MAG: putative FAD-linked oxidoreductase [Alphaproteobacteria bacterium MarineAlpha11_Bin1]|tara:strand:+ start:11078 stop:12514 length:1437 start_codon:yes stop_codon:yes gene_type:complete